MTWEGLRVIVELVDDSGKEESLLMKMIEVAGVVLGALLMPEAEGEVLAEEAECSKPSLLFALDCPPFTENGGIMFCMGETVCKIFSHLISLILGIF